MGIFSGLEERAAPGPADDFWYEPISRYDDEDVTPISALGQSPVWAAVNLISGTLGSLPLVLYKEIPDGGKERDRANRLYDMLRWQPNSFQTAVEFVEMGQGHLCLRGNFFCRLETNRLGELTAIVPLHPDKIQLKLGSGNTIRYHYKETSGKERVFSSEEILHVKGLSSDGLIGYSPITVGAGTVALSAASEKYGSRFFHNSATPSGILSHPGKLKPEARSNIKRSWKQAHGAGKLHSVALLEEGLAWTALSVSPDEAQFIETRRYQGEEIARLFGVPPHLIQMLDRSTFNNVTEQNRSFATNCIRPWATRWEQAIRKSILERFALDGTFVEFELDNLLRPDTRARAEAYQILLQNGALSINEWRTKENMNPLEEEAGRVHWMPLNIQSVSRAEEGNDEEPPTDAMRQKVLASGLQVRKDARPAEIRSLANRIKIAEATKPLILDTAERMVKREIKAVKRLMSKELTGGPFSTVERGTDGLTTALTDYYFGEFKEIYMMMMLPVIRTYAQQIYTQAALEIGYPTDFTDELEEFIEKYTAVGANRYAKRNRQGLQQIISVTPFEEVLNALEIELAKWEEKRAAQVARQQTTQANAAISKYAYVAGGIISLRWVTSGSDTCPWCKRLSGKKVGTQQLFVEAGQAVETDDDKKLTPSINIGHPPLHSGCDCFISPST